MLTHTPTLRKWAPILLVCLALPAFTGCRYATQRVDDFRDIIQLGIGVTASNPGTGIWPPSLGVHAQVTDFVNLGAIHFEGVLAEWDGRGFFAGPELRTRAGFGPLQILRLDQNYMLGAENYFKKADGAWTKRLSSYGQRWWNAPGKELNYEYFADVLHQDTPIFHRGWQHWENIGLEVGICEPFITHAGLTVRVGVDPSEVFDFVLGFFMIDFYGDDVTIDEFNEM